MKLPRLTFVFGLAVLIDLAAAIQLSLKGRRNAPDFPRLGRRGSLSPLNNSADISYYTNLTLGGAQFSMLIDTGSSDLWVAGSVPNSKTTDHKTGVHYAVGAVEGPIKTATLEFAGYTVPDQAFLEVVPSDENPAGTGLIGLGPNSGSNIFRELNNSVGYAVLDRIFLQNTSTPNYLTVNLGRSEDPTDLFPGDLSIGEILQGYGDIVNQPKLPVTDVPVFEVGDQHFQVLLDADGLIGPDGKPIPIRSIVDETSNKQLATAVIDTGFSLTQVPKSVADEIYGRFPGAEYRNVTSVGAIWVVPCDQEVNITFKFGGKSYPIHPLDTTLDPKLVGVQEVKNSKGQTSCLGTYQPFSFNQGASPNYDMILGMSFIRNVYALFNFGDFVGGGKNKDDPYIQFLTTTEASEAHSDFVKVRLGGVDTTKDPSFANNSNKTTKKKNKNLIYYIAGSAAAVLVVIIIGIILVSRARKTRPSKGGAALGSYRPLQEPVDMHVMSTPQPYDPPQHQPQQYYGQPPQQHYGQQPYDPQSYHPNEQYQSPWDQRR